MEKRRVPIPQAYKRTALGICASAVVVFNVGFPKNAEQIDFRPIRHPIAIHLNRFSLAYAALEDDRLDDTLRTPFLPQSLSVIDLKSGSPFALTLLETKPEYMEWVVSQPRPFVERSQAEAIPSVPSRTVILKPLVISKRDVNVAKLLPVQMPEQFQPSRQQKIATQESQELPPQVDLVPTESHAVHRPIADGVAPGVRGFNDLSYDEYANYLVKREVAWRAQQASPNLQGHLRSDEGQTSAATTHVYVGLLQANSTRAQMLPQAAPPVWVARAQTPASQGSSPAMGGPIDPTSATMIASQADAPPQVSVASASHQGRQMLSNPLDGTIEFSDGLAFTSEGQSVVVQHFLDGMALEQGQVQLQQGHFNIDVKDTDGLLVAKLVDGTGEVLGRGEVAIRDGNSYRIRLHPVDGLSGEVISAHSFGRSPIFVRNAYVTVDATSSEMTTLDDGKFEDPAVLPGSSFVVRAEKQGYWGSILVGASEDKLQIPLFPDSMAMALLGETVQDKELAQRKGIIWGRVTRNGLPVAGAQVQLDGAGNYPPVYFPFGQLLIPDNKRTTTGENGYFAFVQVNPGLRSVQLTMPEMPAQAQSIPVDGHFVSQLNFEVANTRTAQVLVTDALDFDKRLLAQVRWNESREVVDFDPAQANPKMVYWAGSGLMFLETDAGNGYWPTRQSFSHTASIFHSTPVQLEWIQKLARESGIRMDMQQGVIFGLTEGPDYDVMMDDTISYSNMNRVFFDARGNISMRGVQGGGFVFFNVPAGVRTIGLQAERSARYGVRVVPVEAGQMNVIHYQFPQQ